MFFTHWTFPLTSNNQNNDLLQILELPEEFEQFRIQINRFKKQKDYKFHI